MSGLALPWFANPTSAADNDGEDEGRARDNRIHDGGGSRGSLVGGDDGEMHAAAAVDEGTGRGPSHVSVLALPGGVDPIIAADNDRTEGRARDNCLFDGGSCGPLVG